MLDCALLFAGLLVLQAVLYPVNPIVAMQREGRTFTGAQLHLWVFATATLPFVLYFALTIASRHQAPLAMRWMRMRVERITGGQMSVAAAFVRSAVLLLPFELNHTVMFHVAPANESGPGAALWIGVTLVWLLLAAYVIAMLVSSRRQSIHDLAAGTMVVDTAP